MSLREVTAEAILKAIARFDELGRDDFLAEYRYGPSRRYVIRHNGRDYDSKAIVGAAHEYVSGRPLKATEFSGGIARLSRFLERRGFEFWDLKLERRANSRFTLGEVDGVPEGTTFPSRQAASDAGVHRALIAGIVGTAATGAESIVVSGGYEDDIDNGWEIIYTGHGGQDNAGRQVRDQTWESSGNAALRTSQLERTPVRVIRGAHKKNGSSHAPASGYRYDGLYLVEDSWREAGRRGFQVCRFRLVKLGTSELTPGGDAATTSAVTPAVPSGNESPARRTTTIQRVVRSSGVKEYVKAIHDHQCQTCNTRLTIGSRGYSEAAHIRPLGTPHNGPDIAANVLCLCPSCHVLFDNGALIIDEDLNIFVNGELTGQLRTEAAHAVGAEYLAYHRTTHK
ncbi:YDG/SRA domain-containing protein [Saccharomonospora sp. NB11]|jgi:putative restriction endonuclease|uniref:YDG/SRA domain-containing protein n=1 Tax=Saccharomonospora sp. NB11 TaxID=1642298 RepID=UPI0018D03E0B|nr:YDG/SRA domain-containing protein [Saccharomonospora sp. NB11]